MIKIEFENETYIRVLAPYDVRKILSDRFSFMVPGARFMPNYSDDGHGWDGTIKLFKIRTGRIYRGLLPYITETLDELGLDWRITNEEERPIYTDEAINEMIAEMKLSQTPRPYQIEGFRYAINNHRAVFESSTGTGKSLLIYMLARYLPGPTLIIVPRKGLIRQFVTNFKKYDPTWDVDRDVQIIEGGQSKEITKPIVLSTWQSIYKQPTEYFLPFMQIIGDECHGFKAKSLTDIVEKMYDTPLRFGFTGTVNELKMDRMVLEGLFGPVVTLKKTREAIDEGYLSPLKIKCLLLKYSERDRKIRPYDYHGEMEFLCTHEGRNQFIENLALDLKGNTLILFQFVKKHGLPLYERLKEQINNKRPLYLVYGEVNSNDRERVRTLLEKDNDAIILGSYGTFSEGIDIPRLHNVIFASPYKSRIKVMQSIGRGLRTAKDKSLCTLYDIADDLSNQRRSNHTFEHYKTRLHYYAEEGFDFKQYIIELE